METKVLTADSPLVQSYLRDFRVSKDGKKFAARVRGEGKFPSTVIRSDAPKQVLVEFLTEQEWKTERPSLFFRWLSAFRLPYLAFSLLPLLLAFCAYHRSDRLAHFQLGILVFLATSLMHISCNLWGEVEDHLRGIDSPGSTSGSGVIRELWIPAIHLRLVAILFFLIGIALGLTILSMLPWESSGKQLLWIGLLGATSAASYSGWPFHYKYIGLGEPILFLVSGPLIAMGACAIFYQDTSLFSWFAMVSTPLAFLAILRLHAGNQQRIPFDTIAGARTIARVFGFAVAKGIYLFLCFVPFAVLIALYAFHLIPQACLAALASLPICYLNWKLLREAKGPLDPICHELRDGAARLQVAFGLLYCLGFLF